MLPDFRFVLGAFLAIAVLSVAGLGLVTSVQLVQEAHMAPLQDTRSLAFSGHAEWNQFYDPEAARRFEGGRAEGPVAAARPQTPEVSLLIAPAGIEERTASILANRIEPGVANDKTETIPPSMAETLAAVTIAGPPPEAAGAPEPTPAERVANAPATLPEPDPRQGTQMPTQMPNPRPTQEPTLAPTQPQTAGATPPESAPPIPPARPKVHFRKRIARAHVRRVAPASQQTVQNPGLPAPWPGYDNQFTGAPTKKNTGKFTGTVADRPQ